MKARVVNLRGRRPLRAGLWSWRLHQLVTMPLAPQAVSFLRRGLVRVRRAGLRLVQPNGMPPVAGVATIGTYAHPGLRRSGRLGGRWIQPADVPL